MAKLLRPPVRFAASLLLASLWFGAALPALAQSEPSAGTIKRVEGSPMIGSKAGQRAAEVGGSIFAGERLMTRAGSAVGLTLMDGTQLAVGPNSSVTLQAFQFDTTTRQGTLLVDIARGALRMVSGLIARSDPRAVAINTPTTTIGIRGTDFIVDLDGIAETVKQ